MSERSARSLGASYASVVVAAALWGTWSIFMRPSGIDPRWSTSIVFASMTLFGSLLLIPKRARSVGARTRTEWLLLASLGLFDAGNASFFFAAMTRTTVAIAVLSHYLAPALVSVFAPTLAGTPPQRGSLVRALIATAGLVLVLEPWRVSHLAATHLIGALFGAISAIFYACNVCVTRRVSARFSAEEQLVYHSAIALVIVTAFAPWSALPSVRSAALVALGGAIVGASAAILFVRGLAKIPPEHAAVLTFIEPLMAVLIGALVFHESLGPLSWVGGAIVLGTGISASIGGSDIGTRERETPTQSSDAR